MGASQRRPGGSQADVGWGSTLGHSLIVPQLGLPGRRDQGTSWWDHPPLAAPRQSPSGRSPPLVCFRSQPIATLCRNHLRQTSPQPERSALAHQHLFVGMMSARKAPSSAAPWPHARGISLRWTPTSSGAGRGRPIQNVFRTDGEAGSVILWPPYSRDLGLAFRWLATAAGVVCRREELGPAAKQGFGFWLIARCPCARKLNAIQPPRPDAEPANHPAMRPAEAKAQRHSLSCPATADPADAGRLRVAQTCVRLYCRRAQRPLTRGGLPDARRTTARAKRRAPASQFAAGVRASVRPGPRLSERQPIPPELRQRRSRSSANRSGSRCQSKVRSPTCGSRTT